MAKNSQERRNLRTAVQQYTTIDNRVKKGTLYRGTIIEESFDIATGSTEAVEARACLLV